MTRSIALCLAVLTPALDAHAQAPKVDLTQLFPPMSLIQDDGKVDTGGSFLWTQNGECAGDCTGWKVHKTKDGNFIWFREAVPSLPERRCLRVGAERSCTEPGSPEGPYFLNGDKAPPVMRNTFCRADNLPAPPPFWAWICENGSPVLIKITEPAHANCPQLATMFPGMDCVATSCDENEIRGLECRREGAKQ